VCVCGIDVVEINRIPHRHMEDDSTPMQPDLRVLSVLPAAAVNAAAALDLHSRFGLICRPWKVNPDSCVGDPDRFESSGESFVSKDTSHSDPDRDR